MDSAACIAVPVKPIYCEQDPDTDIMTGNP